MLMRSSCCQNDCRAHRMTHRVLCASVLQVKQRNVSYLLLEGPNTHSKCPCKPFSRSTWVNSVAGEDPMHDTLQIPRSYTSSTPARAKIDDSSDAAAIPNEVTLPLPRLEMAITAIMCTQSWQPAKARMSKVVNRENDPGRLDDDSQRSKAEHQTAWHVQSEAH